MLALVAIAAATLALPQIELYDTLRRFMSHDEAIRIVTTGFLGIVSTPWAVIGFACAVVVILCMKPRKHVALLLAFLAVGYLALKGALGREGVMIGPFSLLTTILWLYVAVSTFRSAKRSEAREG